MDSHLSIVVRLPTTNDVLLVFDRGLLARSFSAFRICIILLVILLLRRINSTSLFRMNDQGLADLCILYKDTFFLAVSPFTPSLAPLQRSCAESNGKDLFLCTLVTVALDRNCLLFLCLSCFSINLFEPS